MKFFIVAVFLFATPCTMLRGMHDDTTLNIDTDHCVRKISQWDEQLPDVIGEEIMRYLVTLEADCRPQMEQNIFQAACVIARVARINKKFINASAFIIKSRQLMRVWNSFKNSYFKNRPITCSAADFVQLFKAPLLRKYIDVNGERHYGITALHFAALINDITFFRQVHGECIRLECERLRAEGKECDENHVAVQVLLQEDRFLNMPTHYVSDYYIPITNEVGIFFKSDVLPYIKNIHDERPWKYKGLYEKYKNLLQLALCQDTQDELRAILAKLKEQGMLAPLLTLKDDDGVNFVHSLLRNDSYCYMEPILLNILLEEADALGVLAQIFKSKDKNGDTLLLRLGCRDYSRYHQEELFIVLFKQALKIGLLPWLLLEHGGEGINPLHEQVSGNNSNYESIRRFFWIIGFSYDATDIITVKKMQQDLLMSRDRKGLPILHYAASLSTVHIFKFLLEKAKALGVLDDIKSLKDHKNRTLLEYVRIEDAKNKSYGHDRSGRILQNILEIL